MPASSLQVLPCSSQTAYRLSDTTFMILFQTVKILQASSSMTNGTSLSSTYCQSLAAARFHPLTCW